MTNDSKLPSRTKPPEERRAELMDAAELLFIEHGVDATTIEQITAAAGVAKGTFYLHFTSKQDVHTALGERFAQKHLARVKAAIAKGPKEDWPAALANWAKASLTFYLDSIRLHDMCFHEARSSTRTGLVDNLTIDHLTELLRSGVQAEAWAIDDPRIIAVFLFSGIHGVVDDAVTSEMQINRVRLTKVVEQLCSRAVGRAAG